MEMESSESKIRKKPVIISDYRKNLRSPLINNKYTDISNGLEKTKVLFPSKHKTKLLKTQFDYKKDYITKSYIKNANIDEYMLTKEYSCTCEEECNLETCECVLGHVQRYECNNNCACKICSCENRIIQRGIEKTLKVDYINREKGFGVFAKEDIKKDEFICEYVGQIINKDSAKEKINTNMIKKKPNFVLQVRENYEKMIINTFIDAEEKGNVSRFLNHSCKPNLYFDIIRVNYFIPQVAFFALRDIKEGEELTFSYCDKNNTELEESFEAHSYKPCLCGEEKCMKYLPS